jgi:methionyl aminopeptidase
VQHLPTHTALGYSGFRKSIATSLNEVVCHGIPDDRELQLGDIVNIDVSCFVDGFHGDTSRTFLVGNDGLIDYRDPAFDISAHPEVNPEAVRLLLVSEQALANSIAASGPGVPLSKIGDIVSDLCDQHGFEVNRTFVVRLYRSTLHFPPWQHCQGQRMSVQWLIDGEPS